VVPLVGRVAFADVAEMYAWPVTVTVKDSLAVPAAFLSTGKIVNSGSVEVEVDDFAATDDESEPSLVPLNGEVVDGVPVRRDKVPEVATVSTGETVTVHVAEPRLATPPAAAPAVYEDELNATVYVPAVLAPTR
jgi:hypothetical protein